MWLTGSSDWAQDCRGERKEARLAVSMRRNTAAISHWPKDAFFKGEKRLSFLEPAMLFSQAWREVRVVRGRETAASL